MSTDAVSDFEAKLEGLGFERDISMSLRLGSVNIVGGLGYLGFKLMFSQASGRSALQYDVSVSSNTPDGILAQLIRSNLELNFRGAVPLWDDLQQRLKENGAGA
jgi:hypothetical protein